MNSGAQEDQEELSVAEALSQLRQQKQYADERPYSPALLYPVASPVDISGARAPDSSLREHSSLVLAHTQTRPHQRLPLTVEGLDKPDPRPLAKLPKGPGEAGIRKEKRGSPVLSSRFQGPEKAWRKMLFTTASLVLTKDAKKKLRNLLNLLRLASEHLNAKVSLLKASMEKDASDDNVTPALSQVAVRNDIITTIKKSLAMLSTLATNSLPRSARSRLRHMILKLPSRWANQLEGDGSVQSESAVLALATETLLSIHNITSILSETLERADSWVEKLPDKNKEKQLSEAPSSNTTCLEDPEISKHACYAEHEEDADSEFPGADLPELSHAQEDDKDGEGPATQSEICIDVTAVSVQLAPAGDNMEPAKSAPQSDSD